jgi:hypothetical protein
MYLFSLENTNILKSIYAEPASSDNNPKYIQEKSECGVKHSSPEMGK